MSSFHRCILIAVTALGMTCLTACGTLHGLSAHTPATPIARVATEADWHEVRLPGKRATEYTWEHFDGRRVMAARSESSASMMRRKLLVAPAPLGQLNFSWQVSELIADADVSMAETEDSPAKVILAFGGDVGKLPMRTRMLFELAEAVGGEAPPYATLMYAWDNQAAIGSVIINPRTDRIRKIVVDSGPEGLKSAGHALPQYCFKPLWA